MSEFFQNLEHMTVERYERLQRKLRDSIDRVVYGLTHPSLYQIRSDYPFEQLNQCPACRHWHWFVGPDFNNAIREPMSEANEVYSKNGGLRPGPSGWWIHIREATHGDWSGMNPNTTMHYPIDVSGNIESQAAEMKKVCRAVGKTLAMRLGRRPTRAGKHLDKLAMNILLVVLRDWNGATMKALARRLGDQPSPAVYRRIAVRLNATRNLLKKHVPYYEPGPHYYKSHSQE